MTESISTTSFSPSIYPGKISLQQKNEIVELLKILGENNSLSVGLYTCRLVKIKASIAFVHPLTFLQKILKNPFSKAHLKTIFTSWAHILQKTTLLSSFSNNMKLSDLTSWKIFCQKIGKPEKELEPYFNNQNWEELINQCLKS